MFVEKYHFIDKSKRRYSVFMKGDEWKAVKFVVLSLTFVKPTYDAVKGCLRVPDIAWFVNPLMCFATAVIYTVMTIKNSLFK